MINLEQSNFNTFALISYLVIQLFSLSANAFSARESDGEKLDLWRVGDPYHELHIKKPRKDGKVSNLPMSNILFKDEFDKYDISVKEGCLPPYNDLDVDLLFIDNKAIIKGPFVEISNDKVRFYYLNKKAGCLSFNTEMPTDEFVQQIENETLKFKSEISETGFGKNFVYGYDPRVVFIEDRYYITWCNYYHGPTIGIGYTTDFEII